MSKAPTSKPEATTAPIADTKPDAPTAVEGSPIARAVRDLDMATLAEIAALEAAEKRIAQAHAVLDQTVANARAELTTKVDSAQKVASASRAALSAAHETVSRTRRAFEAFSAPSVIAAGGIEAIAKRDQAEIAWSQAVVAQTAAELAVGQADTAVAAARQLRIEDPSLPTHRHEKRHEDARHQVFLALDALVASTLAGVAESFAEDARERAREKAEKEALAEKQRKAAEYQIRFQVELQAGARIRVVLSDLTAAKAFDPSKYRGNLDAYSFDCQMRDYTKNVERLESELRELIPNVAPYVLSDLRTKYPALLGATSNANAAA